MDTGKIIRECRGRFSWSRNRLSEKSGLGVSTIVVAEKNQDCMVSTLEKLLNAMGYEIKIEKRKLI